MSKSGQKLHPERIKNKNKRCPKHPDKDWRPLVQAAWDAGWWCFRGKKYIFCYSTDEKKTIVKIPMTPSGARTYKNKVMDLRAGGLNL